MKNMGKACGKHFLKLKDSVFDLSFQRYAWNGMEWLKQYRFELSGCDELHNQKDTGHGSQTITSLLSTQVRTTTTG